MGHLQPGDRSENLWRRARWGLLAVAIALQSLHVWCFGCLDFGFFNPDKAHQIAAARSLLDGSGLTVPVANPADADAPLRQSLFQWPMGYSLLFAGLWSLLGDLWITAAALEILAVVLFFTAWVAILDRLGPWAGGRVKLLVMAYWTFVWNPLIPLTGPEIVAQALFSWGLAFALAAATGRRPYWASAASAACVVAAAACRFAYWPLVAVVPAALAVAIAFSSRRRQLAIATVLNAVLVGALFLALAAAQNAVGGRTTYLSGTGNLGGPYLGNLLLTCPFPASTLGFDYIWPWLTRQASWLARLPSGPLQWAVSAAVVPAVLAPLVVLAFRLRAGRAAADPPADRAPMVVFAAAGLFTVAATLAMLAYLSIRTPWDGTWTYVSERRYFAVFFSFAGVALAYSLLDLARIDRGPLHQAVRRAAVGLMLVWFLTGAVWRTSRLVRHFADARGHRTARQADMIECRAVCAAVRKHLDRGRPALFVQADSSPVYSCGEKRPHVPAFMAGAPPVSYQLLPALQLPPGKTVAMLAVFSDPRTPQDAAAQELLRSRGGLEPIARLREGWLYESIWSSPPVRRGSPDPAAFSNEGQPGGSVGRPATTTARSSATCPNR